jgi:hypothetical protein
MEVRFQLEGLNFVAHFNSDPRPQDITYRSRFGCCYYVFDRRKIVIRNRGNDKLCNTPTYAVKRFGQIELADNPTSRESTGSHESRFAALYLVVKKSMTSQVAHG